LKSKGFPYYKGADHDGLCHPESSPAGTGKIVGQFHQLSRIDSPADEANRPLLSVCPISTTQEEKFA